MAALYKTGETGSLRVLFSSESPWDWLSRASTLRALIDYDRRLLAATLAASRDLRRMGAEAASAAEERDRALEAVAGRHGLLAQERVEKRDLLTRVRVDGERERALLSESESAAQALERALKRMSRQRGRAASRGGLAARKGRLEAPVSAPVRQPFGRVTDPRFGTQTFRKGVEFDADRGVEVQAVALGEVRYADWFRGYGRIVILDHGEGYFSVYGHLDRIGVRVGQWGERVAGCRRRRGYGFARGAGPLFRTSPGFSATGSVSVVGRPLRGATFPEAAAWARLLSIQELQETMRKFSTSRFGLRRSVFGMAILAMAWPIAGSATESEPVDLDQRYRDLGLFSRVLTLVRANYVEPVDESDLLRGAMHGLLLELDPHSAFMEVEAYEDMQVDTKGRVFTDSESRSRRARERRSKSCRPSKAPRLLEPEFAREIASSRSVPPRFRRAGTPHVEARGRCRYRRRST